MKIFCVSLGCDKNLVDTEMMLGLLNKDGYTFTDDEHEADVVGQYLLLHWRCQRGKR